MRKMIKEGALELPCYITRRMRREQNLDEIIAEITNATVARKIKQTTQVPAPEVSPDLL